MMTQCKPTVGVMGSAGTNSAATAAATRRGGRIVRSKDGHLLGVVSHAGLCCHNVDDVSASVVIPKSAGFSRVGQYFHSAVGSSD